MFDKDGRVEDPFMSEQAREEIRLRLEKSLSELNAQITRLRAKYGEIVARSREYFEQVVEALISGDEERASIYAEEIAEIKKLASVLIKTQLVLEQVKLRLETILEVSELIGLVVPLLSLIAEVRDEVTEVAPDAAKNLQELATYIEDFSSISPVSINELRASNVQELDDEAHKVLEEAQKVAAERVRLSFPDVPELSEEERLVYAYVSRANSEIDLKKCAKDLGIDVRQVKEILERLEEKGLIELVG